MEYQHIIYIYISMEISRGLQLTNYFVFLILEGYIGTSLTCHQTLCHPVLRDETAS